MQNHFIETVVIPLIRHVQKILLALTLILAINALGRAAETPDDSIYKLPIVLVDQDGHDFRLIDRRDKAQLISMFYTSCQYVCPMIIDTLRKTQHALTVAENERLRVLLVSFDAERDTVAQLKKTFEEHKLQDNWTLARTDEASVRKFAAMLDIQYRIRDSEINHSTALVLVDHNGRMVARTDKVGEVDPDFIAAIRKAITVN